MAIRFKVKKDIMIALAQSMFPKIKTFLGFNRPDGIGLFIVLDIILSISRS